MVVALSGYKDIAVISKGAYGTVYQAKNKLTGERVALKTLFLRHYPVQLNAEKKLVPGPGITQTALREISILRALSKKITKEPLIKLKKVLFSSLRIEKLEGQRVFLEFEFCDHDLVRVSLPCFECRCYTLDCVGEAGRLRAIPFHRVSYQRHLPAADEGRVLPSFSSHSSS